MKRLPKARRAPQPIRPPSRSTLVSPGDRRRTGRERGFRLGVVMLLGGALLLLAPATPAGAAPAHAGMPIAPWVAPGPAGVTAPLQALLAVQQLTAPDGGAGDYCGSDVAISGDTALVSAPRHDVGGNASRARPTSSCAPAPPGVCKRKLTAADGAGYDEFGTSVALSGDTALVGAYGGRCRRQLDQGSAYVFVRSGTTWSQQAKLTAADGAADDSSATRWPSPATPPWSGPTARRRRQPTPTGRGLRLRAHRHDLEPAGQADRRRRRRRRRLRRARSPSRRRHAPWSGAVWTTSAQPRPRARPTSSCAPAATWSQQAKLTAADGAVSDWFGRRWPSLATPRWSGLTGDTSAPTRPGFGLRLRAPRQRLERAAEADRLRRRRGRLFGRVGRARRRHSPGRGLPATTSAPTRPGLGLRLRRAGTHGASRRV